MIYTLGDVIADLSLHIEHFPIRAQDLKPVSYLEIGPGGATNIAIMSARFGLAVGCLGEIGDDQFGSAVRQGLAREGIDTTYLITRAESKTPVAGVIVDAAREPAYLGYMGALAVRRLPDEWRKAIQSAQALFADGWIEIPEMAQMILDAFALARAAHVPTFFDPGPGNGMFDNAWHLDAAARATVLLLNAEEAQRLTGGKDALQAAHALMANGSELVVLKRGAEGLVLGTRERVVVSPGFPVKVRDLTGAGDSLTGAVLYAYLHNMDLEAMGVLANATGAAKVQKRGTGHNMPTLEEIRRVLERAAPDKVTLI